VESCDIWTAQVAVVVTVGMVSDCHCFANWLVDLAIHVWLDIELKELARAR